jgi:cell division protein FtsN
MSNPQRGVYQPLGDNVSLYDLTDEEIEEERSRLPLLIVIALIVLAAFTGVVWLAYNQGVAHGRSSVETVVNAPDGPVRTAPEDANAGATPFKDLKIYRQPVPPDQEAQNSSLAPTVSPGGLDGSPVQVARQAQPPAATEAPPARLDPPPAPSAPAPRVASPPTPATAPAAVTTKPASSAPPPVTGGVLLQIGSYESVEIANGAWATFKARHAAIIGNLSQDVQKADLGAKGTWYRLRVGPFADKAAAAAACDKLRAEGSTCFVAP